VDRARPPAGEAEEAEPKPAARVAEPVEEGVEAPGTALGDGPAVTPEPVPAVTPEPVRDAAPEPVPAREPGAVSQPAEPARVPAAQAAPEAAPVRQPAGPEPVGARYCPACDDRVPVAADGLHCRLGHRLSPAHARRRGGWLRRRR
jgi:hypothetical protein